VFRDIHTIKGTASSFGLSAVAEIAGTLENALSTLRETSGIRPDMIEATRKSLALLTKAVLAAVESVKSIMGDDFVDDSDIYLRISLTKLKSETAAINELLSRELIDKTLARSLQQKIEKKLRSFQHTPARKALAKALKIVPELLTRVHKNIRFSFDGAEMPLDCEMARELNTPLVHLIRNAFDHGIEKTCADRIAAGKPAEGHVSLSISADERNITMEIRDDGRGIDTDAVKRVGLAKGLITAAQAEKMTSEEFFSLICYPGFSTNVGLTEISGRGVGLDIVLTAVSEKLHGRVFILSESGKGTTVRIQIPTTLP
jgi:two-component system chemotaxis sensor kinase CheA